ncbi:MAG TPA: hypothetical protein VFS10_05655 [Pyrinomonadaceae bacterium]|nr:hypothetical protein [Pyrinomonadaceae bacterium]
MSALEQRLSAEAEAAHAQRARRLRPPMHCYWGTTEACPRNGRITSLGVESCFVKTKAEAQDGQLLYVNLWLPTERWLLVRGKVTYRMPKVGYGLSFVELAETEREMLRTLLDFFGEEAGPPPDA